MGKLIKSNREEIIKRAWELYMSPEKEEIVDYTKYDALFDVTRELDIPDGDYQEMMDEMRYM